jgi:hypothetical protein
MTASIHKRSFLFQHTALLFLLAALCAAFVAAGCERGGPGSALGITPGAVTLNSATRSVIFTVGSGTNAASFPLEWTVSDPYLGGIVRSEGPVATYVRLNPDGRNVVTAKDQNGVEGIAFVYQIQ